MISRHPTVPRWRWALLLGAGVVLGLGTPKPARAQATVNAEAGLGGWYKPQQWVPVQVTYMNQGAPTRMEVRARFAIGDTAPVHQIPELRLAGSANERRTLYLRAPASYSAQQLIVEPVQEGRVGRPIQLSPRQVNPGDWLIVGVGSEEERSSVLGAGSMKLGANQFAPGTQSWTRGSGQAPTVQVGTIAPANVPDRWQGLQAADLLIMGSVSERDLSPEQQTAIRDYVSAGGTLVVTGGVNALRLTSRFYQDLLPVTVTGTSTGSAADLTAITRQPPPPGGAIPIAASRPKPGTQVLLHSGGTPLIASANKGAGRVVFVAFDPSRPPFRGWEPMNALWRVLLTAPRAGQVIAAVSRTDAGDQFQPYGSSAQGTALAEAPYAISQLDIPSFYIVALFLLAYIVVLVPVNYYVLKARDKKEYAWLTTPLIVLLFSLGAYMIGYGFKGGRTLLAKVAVVEARAGQDTAPSLAYAGLFSPRKTTYDVQLAPDATGQSEAATTLLSEPASDRVTSSLRVIDEDIQRIDDMPVDMWAMRVLKAEGLERLGRGFQVDATQTGGQTRGTIRNSTAFDLEDCHVVSGNAAVPVADLPKDGRPVPFSVTTAGGGSGTFLPQTLLSDLKGDREQLRMKRAVLGPLCSGGYSGPNGWPTPQEPLLVGWAKEPIARFQINGSSPREQSSTLVIVHLDKNGLPLIPSR